MARTKQMAQKSTTADQKKLWRKVLKEQTKEEPDVKRKRYRYRPGTVALREIRKYQRSTKLLIPKLAFQRVVREIAENSRPDLKFQASALMALQEAAESYLVQVFTDANLAAIHAGRVGIYANDIQFSLRLSGERF